MPEIEVTTSNPTITLEVEIFESKILNGYEWQVSWVERDGSPLVSGAAKTFDFAVADVANELLKLNNRGLITEKQLTVQDDDGDA